jgi:ankyrin repeat protein
LIFAAREGDLESAKLLLAAGADVNQTTNFGWTPLLTATQNRNYKLAEFLIENGADVNIANKGGWTPLYLATDNRNIEAGDYPWPKPDMDHLEFIKFLLDHRADPNGRIQQSFTLNRTVFNDQWFQEPGATAFVRAAQSGDLELMKLLLARGADPMIRTDFGDTALAAASGIGWIEGITYEWSRETSLEAVKLLLGLGLDPNSVNHDGRTPLMGAAHKGRNEVVQLLVDSGARLEVRDYGSRDTDRGGTSALAGHTWQAIDYAEGLVRVGVQSALVHPETAALIRKLMVERGFPVPDLNRTVESVCIVVICKGELLPEQ